VKLRYYLKFHGARTAFGRVIKGKMTSAGHRTVPGQRPVGVCTHRTGTGRFLYKKLSYDFNGARPGTVRCPAGHRTMSDKRYDQHLLKNWPMPVRAPDDARPGTGRCSSGHRPMFYESNCHRWEATCFCRCTYCIYIDISLLKTKNINTKIYISLEQLKMINMQRTNTIEFFAALSKCSFHHHQCQSQPQFFLYFNNLFLQRNDGKFWYKRIHHCTWKFA